jgi:hypothetical protein
VTQQHINLGAAANDGTGDDLRTGGTKINLNFTELYGLFTGSAPAGSTMLGSDQIHGSRGGASYDWSANQITSYVQSAATGFLNSLFITGAGAAASRAFGISVDAGYTASYQYYVGSVIRWATSRLATGEWALGCYDASGSLQGNPIVVDPTTLTVTTSGNLTASGDLRALGSLRVTRSSAVCGYFTRHDTATMSYTLSMTRGRGDTTTPALLQNGDGTGILFNGQYDASNSAVLGSIRALCIEPTPGSAAMGGRISLHASAHGTISNNEVARFEYDTGLSMFGSNRVIDENRLHRARSYTVATLPTAGTAGRMAYASNCRAFNGAGTQEAAGAGTGSLVIDNGSAWKIAGTNVTAVA